MKNKINTWLTIATVAVLSACATSPTGRNQILLYSNEQLASMGNQAFTSLKSEIKIVDTNATENTMVQCIAERLLIHVPESVFSGEWEVVVFDDPQANAFALPGGKIGVYTGLLNVASNQHQVAAVVGHEIGHVIAQHGNERMSQSTLTGLGQQAVAVALEANEVAQSDVIMQALGVGVQVAVMLPYSRAHESEADLMGLELMAKAGFKPSESVELWKNMASLGGERPPEFLSTHPAEQTRIENLSRNLEKAQQIYQLTEGKANCE